MKEKLNNVLRTKSKEELIHMVRELEAEIEQLNKKLMFQSYADDRADIMQRLTDAECDNIILKKEIEQLKAQHSKLEDAHQKQGEQLSYANCFKKKCESLEKQLEKWQDSHHELKDKLSDTESKKVAEFSGSAGSCWSMVSDFIVNDAELINYRISISKE